MQSRTTKISIKFKRGEHENNSSVIPALDNKKMERKEPNGPKNPSSIDNKRMEQIESGASGSTNLKNAAQQHVDISSSGEDEECNTEDEDTQSLGDADKQLVLYDPSANGAGEIQVIPDPITYKQPSLPRYPLGFQSSRVLPSVGAFTVQCANCFKWRLIPSKEKYEEIREHITDHPFVCEKARDWRPSISCNDPPDIEQDGSRLWAIDKPNIAQPPPGWQRLLRIRGEGSTKFADVYYAAPSGKRLRSMVEVQKFLFDNPKYVEQGVNISQFSFQIPRPLQDNYVRKRPPRMTILRDGSYLGMPGSLESSEVSPIAWAGPEENIDLQLGMPGVTGPYCERPALDPINRSAKKARSSSSSKRRCNFDFVYQQHQM